MESELYRQIGQLKMELDWLKKYLNNAVRVLLPAAGRDGVQRASDAAPGRGVHHGTFAPGFSLPHPEERQPGKTFRQNGAVHRGASVGLHEVKRARAVEHEKKRT